MLKTGGIFSVLVTVLGNGYGDMSINPGRNSMPFKLCWYHWEKYEPNYFPSSYG